MLSSRTRPPECLIIIIFFRLAQPTLYPKFILINSNDNVAIISPNASDSQNYIVPIQNANNMEMIKAFKG